MIKGLYYITDADPAGRYLETTRAVLQGGARTIQYRSKSRSIGDQRDDARQLRRLCHEFGARLLVNDDPELAADVEADGVHLGQSDAPVSAARQLLGSGHLIGVSTRTLEQALRAEAEGADYIAVGSIYPTPTKQDAVEVGLERLEKIRRGTQLPLVAIGGIRRDLAPAVLEAGADALAVISALADDRDPQVAARELTLLFNRDSRPPFGRVLTVAGSDSGGGAGVQADLKTMTLLGGYGMSAITALTAQNTLGVTGIHPCPADFVADQLETVLSDLGCDTLKTGMLFSADIVSTVASAIDRYGLLAVVDPVMIAKGGAPLLQQQAVDALKTELLPFTYLLTPNLPEAEALSGIAIETETEMERAARKLQAMGARNVLLKGGHLKGAAVDLLLAEKNLHRFASERIETANTHGTGCTYSAAIATLIAQGQPLPMAVKIAKQFISTAIRTAPDFGGGHGPVNHWQGAKAVLTETENR